MIDLGKSLFEDREYRFDRLRITKLVINPEVKGYPPIFLICRDRQGGMPVEFALAVNYEQMNQLIMSVGEVSERIAVAEAIADTLIPKPRSHNYNMNELIGHHLTIRDIQIKTRLKRFITEPKDEESTLYFFEWEPGN